jgi:hypothetical protein
VFKDKPGAFTPTKLRMKQVSNGLDPWKIMSLL